MMNFIFIFFMVGRYGLADGIIIEYIYKPNGIPWGNAQQYCRQYYTDLVTLNSTEDQQQLLNIFPYYYAYGWIGLYRQWQNQDWQWSDGQPVLFSPWQSGYPNTDYNEDDDEKKPVSFDCTILNNGQWQNYDCGNVLPYYCYTHLILVNEKKTWDEALQLCTTNYTGLAHLPDAAQVLQAQTEIALSQTVNVWTGLRFMNGNWFWLNGVPIENSLFLPPCPARPYHCGAFNSTTNVWQNRDCDEKLDFLCYK